MNNELTNTKQQIEKSEHFSFLPARNIDEMTPSLSIADLSRFDQKRTKVEVVKIIHKYLSATPKAKSLNELSFELITDDILETDKYLTLQEIDFIFSMGVKGKLCINYQDINIDTILGQGGWIDIYHREYKGRKKVVAKPEYVLTGNEITYQEFLSKHPEYANKSLIPETKPKAQEWTIDLLKEKLGDSFSELYESASKEFDNAMDRLEVLRKIVQKEHTTDQGAMYDVYLQTQKNGKEKFIINRLRRKVK